MSRQNSTSFDDAEKQPTPHGDMEKSTMHTDQNIVTWDGPEDPSNPMNWTSKAKITNAALVIVLTFLTPLASSMFAPGVPDVLREFRTSATTIAELVVSIYILGFAVGPLVISPLSEMYGRYPVYVVCNVFFIIFTIACAVASSIEQLIVFRFFAGCFGVCPVTLGGASISDLLAQDKRGAGMALFGMGPLLGPVSANPFPHTQRMQLTLTSGHRPYRRRLPLRSSRLALDILGHSHSLRSLHHCALLLLQRNILGDTPRQKDETPTKGNWKHEPTVRTRRWSDNEEPFLSIHDSTFQASDLLAYRELDGNICSLRLRSSVLALHDFHVCVHRVLLFHIL